MLTDAQSDPTTLTRVGDMAPVFTCRTIEGKVVDITEMTGNVILINFFATWCPPCNQELPVLETQIWKKYHGNSNFFLLVIGREHDEKAVSEYALSGKFSMPFVADPDRSIYKLFATQYIPRNVLIDKSGKIIFQNRGYTTQEFETIENLIAENLEK
jgi:peroxiredoxin